MKAKKHFGQNFLNSDGALDSIIKTSNISEGDFVLEIGPGKGKLTERLLQSGATILAIEKDNDLIPVLEEKFANEIKNKKLILKNEDILDFDTTTLPEQYKLIANIPYYITGKILRIFSSIENLPKQIVMIVQKEVAERIVAKDKKESVLSIAIKSIGDPKYIQTVKKGSFWPIPKIDSAIISIENISNKNFENINKDTFFEIVKAGFSQKRKTLFNNLKNIKDIENVLAKSNIKKESRAEDLKIEDWLNITKNL